MARRMAERSSEHPALANINTLTLESEGALSCRQLSGAHCTSEEIKALNEHVAQPLRSEIYEVAGRPKAAGQNSIAQNQTSTPSSPISTTAITTSTTPSGNSLTQTGDENHATAEPITMLSGSAEMLN